MPLWIRSQDKISLIECNNFIIVCRDNGFAIHTCVLQALKLNARLGYYSTKEKALKVLDKIQEHITKNEAGIYNSKFGVYQMPQDDEVK